MNTNSSLMIAVIEQAGVSAHRIAFTLAAIIFLFGDIFMFRRRHQFFDRDPNVENDVPVVRHNREEAIIFVWSGLMLVLLSILYQVWRAIVGARNKKQVEGNVGAAELHLTDDEIAEIEGRKAHEPELVTAA